MKRWLELISEGLGEPQVYDDKDELLVRGAPARHAFILVDGAVELVQRSPEGQSLVVKILAAPTLFGAIEPLAHEPEYLESVRVLGHARCARLDAARFLEVCRTDPAAGFECLRDMSVAFCVAARFETAPMQETEARLANLLLAYSEVIGEPEGPSVRLSVKRTQADFAEAIGAGERSVNRLLAGFKDARILEKSQARYILRDLEALREMAGELVGSLVHRPEARE